jgi:hypothetical protein
MYPWFQVMRAMRGRYSGFDCARQYFQCGIAALCISGIQK